MKRLLCSQHSSYLKMKPVGLSETDCTVCRWESRPWTLGDFASEMEDLAGNLRICQEEPYFDPHGITYGNRMENLILNWMKTIHKDYRKNILARINHAFGARSAG